MPTKIEWTQGDDGAAGETWNSIRGCSRISPGCGGGRGQGGCYAERQAARQSGAGGAYEGLVRLGRQGPRWTGKVVVVADKILEPLHWKKPRRIFVNSMSDLFHERLSNAEIAAVFCVMAEARQHTFQTLTKRATRMREWFAWLWTRMLKARADNPGTSVEACYAEALISAASMVPSLPDMRSIVKSPIQWPLPNVWLGVSVEDQQYADERLPELLRCPAAVRFVSYEPALGPVELAPWLRGFCPQCNAAWQPQDKAETLCGPCGGYVELQGPRRLDWIIVGGESGPGSRPFNIAWARSVVRECKEAKVACFVKQLGRKPVERSTNAMACEVPMPLVSRKGNDMDEWPMDLRVRQWPKAVVHNVAMVGSGPS